MNLKRRVIDSIKDKVEEDFLKKLDNNETGTKPQGPSEFKQSMQYLDEKLNNIKLDETAWDRYNIVTSITSAAESEAKIAALVPGTAAISNITSGEYRKGDIIIKKPDGEIIKISFENVGVYVPTPKVSGNTLTIKYTYQDLAGQTEISVDPISIADVTNSKTYDITATPVDGRVEIDVITYNTSDASHTVWPVIKCYDKDGELVEGELRVKIENGKVVVSNIPSVVTKVVFR